MTAFILLYCYLFIVWALSSNIKDYTSKRRFQAVASGLGLLFLLGLHSPTLGVDVAASYVPAFEHVRSDFTMSTDPTMYNFEWGFVDYMVLIHRFTSDVQVYLFITAVVILAPIVHFIYKYSENVMLSVVIYASWFAYYFSFSGIRQSIAISVCVVATHFLFKRKLLPFVLIVFMASRIHTSAMLYILAYPLYVYRLSNKKMMLWGIACIAVLILFQDTMQFVAMILFGSDNKYADRFSSVEFGGYTMAIVYFVLGLYQLYLDKRNSNFYIPFIFFLAVIQTTGIYSQTIPRLAYYFAPLFALSFPQALANKPRATRLANQALLVVMFVSFFFLQAGSGYLNVVPFKFFWE